MRVGIAANHGAPPTLLPNPTRRFDSQSFPLSIGRGLMRPQAAVDPRAIAEPTEHRAFRVGRTGRRVTVIATPGIGSCTWMRASDLQQDLPDMSVAFQG